VIKVTSLFHNNNTLIFRELKRAEQVLSTKIEKAPSVNLTRPVFDIISAKE